VLGGVRWGNVEGSRRLSKLSDSELEDSSGQDHKDNVLDSQLLRRGKRLEYKIKWKRLDQDLDWYNTDGGEFDNCQDLVEDFHRRYPTKPKKA
jgi:hypothetical protein